MNLELKQVVDSVDIKKTIDRKAQIRSIQQCFRVLYLDNKTSDIYVPACVQFKIKDFTQVNFQTLSAQVNGVLCVNFLIFTHDKDLQKMLLDRLYWNQQQQLILRKNRRKKIQRNGNYVPIMSNKDINMKVPTTRTKQFEVQCFKNKIYYDKDNKHVYGWRVCHVLRKQFKVQIMQSSFWHSFVSPFNLINLDLTITLDHMQVKRFKYQQDIDMNNKDKQYLQLQLEYLRRENQYINNINQRLTGQVCKTKQNQLLIKRIHFNTLRIQEPLMNNMNVKARLQKLSPMLIQNVMGSFGKYDIAQTKLEAFTYDQRQIIDIQNAGQNYSIVLEDKSPIQLYFKPFKYTIFRIPLYRYPIIDLVTIFVPLYLLSIISIMIFYQNTQVMNRILNIAALMIAYATIQPIVRQNLPDATSITLIDFLIYLSLIVNILFLGRSIRARRLFDDPQPGIDQSLTNFGYRRQDDVLFIISIILTIINVATVATLSLNYLCKKGSYKCKIDPKKNFQISKDQNWTLKLMMNRSFARYKNTLNKLDQIDVKKQKSK